MDIRSHIRSGLDLANTRTLEIGPLYRPFVLKAEGPVFYVDHADTETLRTKYKDDPKFNVADIVEVDAVWGKQSLTECVGPDRRFDLVIASHVIEHVPDLISWLGEIRSVLDDGGELRLVIPDKRYTFDYTRQLTSFADILDAWLRKARMPLPRCILDHVLNVRSVDTAAAWQGPLDEASLPHLHPYELAIFAANDALYNSNYHDVHCWVFTPERFAALMKACAVEGLVELECVRFDDTPQGSLEFTVFVRPCSDRKVAEASWEKMQLTLASAATGSNANQAESPLPPGQAGAVAEAATAARHSGPATGTHWLRSILGR